MEICIFFLFPIFISISCIVRCIAGDTFDVEGATKRFVDLGCNSQPTHENVDDEDKPSLCGPAGEGQWKAFGYPIEGGFEATGSACFNSVTAHTLYTEHMLWNENQARDTGNERPDWDESTFFPNVDCDDVYSSVS